MDATLPSPHDAHPIAPQQIAALLRDAASLMSRDPDATRTRLEDLAELLGLAEAAPSRGGEVLRLLAPWQARRVHGYIEEHLGSAIRIETLAELTRLSVSYFFRAFRGSFGMAPHAFVMRCRTDRAMRLLREGDDPISQIALCCGFADQAHFSRVFAREAGLPPGAWRRLQRGGISLSRS
jgi:AraC-like DNA-binding protein